MMYKNDYIPEPNGIHHKYESLVQYSKINIIHHNNYCTFLQTHRKYNTKLIIWTFGDYLSKCRSSLVKHVPLWCAIMEEPMCVWEEEATMSVPFL